MRVIAGEKRHLLLKTVNSNDIRPTTDIIKETLFNMIQFELYNVNFLDLFAGSGAIGIEALSRGAKFCTFVDNNILATNVIKENLLNTKLMDKASIIKNDVNIALYMLAKNEKIYDIVFMDPPYEKDLYIEPLITLSNSKIIDKNSKIIIETSIKDDVNKIIELGYNIVKVKEYKNNKHIFLRLNKE